MNTCLTPTQTITGSTAGSEDFMPQPTAARRLTASEPRARILYVEDEPQLRSLGELMLLRMGYDVNTAADGAQGWEVLQHAHYNLLITDHAMPGLTGLELASYARVAGMRLPIMMISGSLSPLQDPAWEQLDIAAFLPKPFAFDALVQAVDRVLLSANHGRRIESEMDSAFWRIACSIEPYQHGGLNE